MEIPRLHHGDMEQVRHTEWERGKSDKVEEHRLVKMCVNLSYKGCGQSLS